MESEMLLWSQTHLNIFFKRQILIYMVRRTVCTLTHVFNFTLQLTLAYSVTLHPNFSIYFLHCIWSAYKSPLRSTLSSTWKIFVFSLCNTILQQCQLRFWGFFFFGSLDFVFLFVYFSKALCHLIMPSLSFGAYSFLNALFLYLCRNLWKMSCPSLSMGWPYWV